MHSKRRQILDILKMRGSSTVEELRRELGITGVTVRNHLEIMRAEELVGEPSARHRSAPGRPQYEYALTAQAEEHFPKSYADLAFHLMEEVKSRYGAQEFDGFFAGVTDRILSDMLPVDKIPPLGEHLDSVVERLNEKGYVARWEQCDEGAMLFTCNCPYDGLAIQHPELCSMDLGIVSSMVGRPVERVCHLASGDDSCAYLIREPLGVELAERNKKDRDRLN